MITDDPDVILSNFDSISYDKGASIIQMMANFIGTKTFDQGIAAYLNKFKFRNAAKVIDILQHNFESNSIRHKQLILNFLIDQTNNIPL